MKWDLRVEYVDNILDLRPGVKTVIIGTLFKLQSKKPSVFNGDDVGLIKSVDQVDLSFGLTGVDGEQELQGKYISKED